MVAGSVLVLIFGLFRWFTWEASIDNVVVIPEQTSNAFDYLLTGVLPWLLLVGAGVVVVLLATGALLPGKVPWPMVLVGVTGLAFVLILIRLILGQDVDAEGDVDVDVSRGIGIWMSALGGLVAFVGAFIGFRNTGFDTDYQPVTGGPRSGPGNPAAWRRDGALTTWTDRPWTSARSRPPIGWSSSAG